MKGEGPEFPDEGPAPQSNDSSGEPKGEEHSKAGGGPFAIMFPPEQAIWTESRRLVADKNTRVETLALLASQDPVIAIELLRISNAMYFAGGKSAITTMKQAIIRLGSDVVLETLENLKDRPIFENEDVAFWFEAHRARGKKLAIVAKVLAEAVARTLSDDCEMAALLMRMGEMLAVAYFREEYIKLAEEHSRSGVNYRLAQDHKFDVERMGLNYLRRLGIPEALLFAIDRDGRSRTPDRAIMKPLCAAAQEMVEAFESNRWEKLTPGKPLPPKSAIRMLGLSDPQYLKLYERISEYLFSSRLEEEKKKQDAIITSAQAVTEEADSPEAEVEDSSDSEFQSEIQNIIDVSAEDEEQALKQVKETKSSKKTEPAAVEAKPKQTVIKAIPESIEERNEIFSLKKPKTDEKKVPRVEAKSVVPIQQPPAMRTAGANKVLSSVSTIMDSAATSEELLSSLLQMLVDQGPFEKSAIIVVSKDRKNAIVVAARGPNIGNGQKLELKDPLSPLAKCFSKVQSFGNRSSQESPFGSKAFALAPIDADHETPVALYADCGPSGSISFEARRIFRNVVDILNQKLPSVPGGIPVEI